MPAWAAFLVGGFIVTWPMYVAWTNPGERGNRRQIAIAQAFMACLLVHFSRGRYESQVAAVASFIFVALYRDARTLLLATGILAVDYVLGTFFWSEALYGHRTVSSWAWVRHIARLTVEDVSLIVAIYKSKQDLKRTAQRTAGIEGHQAVLEREVAERQRTEGLLSLQYSLTRLLATSGTLREAAPEMLRIVGQSYRWDLGELWEVDEREQFLRCVEVWHAPESPMPAHLAVRRGVELRPEEDLPGPGLEPPPAGLDRRPRRRAKHPAHDGASGPDADAVVGPVSMLRALAGLRGAFAVPLRNGPDVIGVIAFFSREPRPPDDEQLSMMSALAGQIGQFMDRKRVELGLRLAHAELESNVEKRTRQLRETNEKLQLEVTERERVQRELINAKELADAANHAKSSFLANMSHELRTPLNAVIGFSELLEQEIFGTLTDKQRSYVGNVLISGRHLLQLVNDILDISKVEAGRMDLVCEWTHLGSIVDVVRSVIQAQAAKKGINLEVSIDEVAAGDLHRPGTHQAGALQPGEQRHQVHAARRDGAPERVPGRRPRRDRRRRHRRRHRRREPAAPLSRIRADSPGARRAPRGHRPRAGADQAAGGVCTAARSRSRARSARARCSRCGCRGGRGRRRRDPPVRPRPRATSPSSYVDGSATDDDCDEDDRPRHRGEARYRKLSWYARSSTLPAASVARSGAYVSSITASSSVARAPMLSS